MKKPEGNFFVSGEQKSAAQLLFSPSFKELVAKEI
jgi:hypothetical protein